MVVVKKELLSPCGLYCGVCRVYVAHRDDDKEFKQGVYNFDCGEVYLTISLTLPFEDYAYKLVAAGIGLEL